MSDEWIVLSTKQEVRQCGGACTGYRKGDDHAITIGELLPNGTFESFADEPGIYLTKAEALAFVIHSGLWREVPEVRAMAEANQQCAKHMTELLQACAILERRVYELSTQLQEMEATDLWYEAS